MHTALGPTAGPHPDGQGSPDPRTSPDRRREALRHLARLARTLGGVLLLVVGAAMLVLPGPGILVIVAGLTLLAVDYVWAKRLLATARQRFGSAGHNLANRIRRGRD